MKATSLAVLGIALGLALLGTGGWASGGASAAAGIQVSSVTPAKGPANNDVLVVIHGTGFPTSSDCAGPIIDITIGGSSAFPLEPPTAIEVRVVAPPGGAGPVDIVVKNLCNGTAATVRGGYTYLTASLVRGSVPPNGGYGLFVFGGGTNAELVKASGCPAATASFWATNSTGQFVTYIPGAAVEVANASWNQLFPDGIPYGTALIGRCV